MTTHDQRSTNHKPKAAVRSTRSSGDRRRSFRVKSRGQAVVETALLGLFLAMLLAAAVDFGRAFYTGVVVENMAGEGGSDASKYPGRDIANPACKGGLSANNNIHDPGRQVDIDRGLIIHRPSQADVAVNLTLSQRCSGVPVKVTVTYQLTDLFLPRFLGVTSITIRKDATQVILENGTLATGCNGS